MEVFQFEKLLQYIEGLLETQEKRMCASFPEGNAAKWVNTCQMSRQKGSHREFSLKWRCRAKSMGFSLLFLSSLLKRRSQIQNGLIQREDKMREEFFEDILKIAHQKSGKDFLEDVSPKICRIGCSIFTLFLN